jgi:hypothetical protein
VLRPLANQPVMRFLSEMGSQFNRCLGAHLGERPEEGSRKEDRVLSPTGLLPAAVWLSIHFD